MQPRVVKDTGILNPQMARMKFQLNRYLPAEDIGFFVERYWLIRWDLRTPYVQETLPHPCVNFVLEAGQTGIFGIETGKFSRKLEGKGRVFGIKFRPGGFYPFIQSSIARLTNHLLTVLEVFGVDGEALAEEVLSAPEDETQIQRVEAFLRQHLPPQDENITLINQIIAQIGEDRSITRVDDLLPKVYLTKRTLQRLFSQYVGVSPKWVIQRYRLHEAAEQVIQQPAPAWADIATALGYFDQAHFIKDFKAIIGATPSEYVKRSAALGRS